jgi:hypothetical protein
MKLDDIGPLIVLVIAFALVSTILYFLVRFWGECRIDTEHARERISWPTTTVQASLFEVSLRTYRVDRPPRVIGHYRYEFGGEQHTVEITEAIYGPSEDREEGARALEEAGKVIDLELQYDPDNPAVFSNEIVTYVPSCRWWIGGFLVFFALMMLLILRGFFKFFFG